MGKTLDGKVAVVTGGAMGNGLGGATQMARAGASVYLIDPNEKVLKSAEKLAAEVGAALGAAGAGAADGAAVQVVRGCVGNVTDPAGLAEIAAEIFAAHGRIDILFNNAGVQKVLPFLEVPDEVRDWIFDVNIKGIWNTTRAVLPYMLRNGYGKIINMSSVTGPVVVDPKQVAYAASKAAIQGFTKALAMEFAGQGIRVNAIMPGYILTPGVELHAEQSSPGNPGKVIDGIAAGVPLGRLGTIEELGDLVCFLASPGSDYITGTSIIIDGGSTLPESGAMGH
ncbi:MAG: SDR family oxidoreductase [Clostridiales Family XIII bacterium]|jgi:NAD(P)-dependent dehydrogenase (short-subunit alcohol dehydrogenase family)|nr:SDR family oxidoreductase [Clostridiales Family XIII bacterium]